jgi:type 1 glutamine amidotransferase
MRSDRRPSPNAPADAVAGDLSGRKGVTSLTDSRTALVVRGGWEGHQPVAATALFIPFLERNGYHVRVEESPEVFADAGVMTDVDLILLCVSMSTIDRPQLDGLRGAVENGTGLAGWHGGIVDSYRNPDYLQLIGGQFAAHPGIHPDDRTGQPTDSFVRHTVTMLPAAAGHPITQGLGDFELVTEPYWVLTDSYNDVLATTTQQVRDRDPWHRPVTSPAVWTRAWGSGRIFVATPGHDLEVLGDRNVRTLIERGLLWASR